MPRTPAQPAPSVPEYRTYFNPILAALKALGGSASIDELNAKVAADLRLGDEVLAVPHDPEHGGRSEFAYRMAWARTYLKTAGLVTNSERSVWSLTPEGMKVDRVDEKKVAKEVQAKRKGTRPRSRDEQAEHDTEPDEAEADEEPTDWKHELLDRMTDSAGRAHDRRHHTRGFVSPGSAAWLVSRRAVRGATLARASRDGGRGWLRHVHDPPDGYDVEPADRAE